MKIELAVHKEGKFEQAVSVLNEQCTERVLSYPVGRMDIELAVHKEVKFELVVSVLSET